MVRTVVHAMPPEDQVKIKGTILSTTWYPFELGNRLDKAIVQVLGKGKESFFEELGAESRAEALPGSINLLLSIPIRSRL